MNWVNKTSKIEIIKTICHSVNHTRLPKEDHLPDWARRDNKVIQGDRVECEGASELKMQRIVQYMGPQKHMNMFLVLRVVLFNKCRPKRRRRSSAFWFRVSYEMGVYNFVWICWMGWMVNATPRPLYPWETPGAHCWVSLRTGLDRSGNSPLLQDSIPGPSSPIARCYTDYAIPAPERLDA